MSTNPMTSLEAAFAYDRVNQLRAQAARERQSRQAAQITRSAARRLASGGRGRG